MSTEVSKEEHDAERKIVTMEKAKKRKNIDPMNPDTH
jgi:hypothetical protein